MYTQLAMLIPPAVDWSRLTLLLSPRAHVQMVSKRSHHYSAPAAAHSKQSASTYMHVTIVCTI